MERVFEKAAAERERWGIPALAVGLLLGSRAETAGFGDCSAATSFRIASITKPFTAMLAAETLDLDEPLQTPAGPATPRQLLSHQAGLKSEAAEPFEPDAPLAEVLAGAVLGAWGRPGELYSYANSGYWLVGRAIEQATSLPFEQAMRERVLSPLRLAATGFDPPEALGHEPATPGGREHRPFARAPYPRARRPSGGLVSTVGDLLRFARHQLAEPSLASLREPLVHTPKGSYGLGWALERRGAATLVSHSGSVAGYQSLLVLVPEQGFAFAGLSNSSLGGAAIRRVCGLALRELLELPRDEPRYVELAPHELAVLAGTYGDGRVRADVSVGNGGLRIALTEEDPVGGEQQEPPFAARPVGARSFVVVEGAWKGDRFDFPGRYLRLGSLLERVEE